MGGEKPRPLWIPIDPCLNCAHLESRCLRRDIVFNCHWQTLNTGVSKAWTYDIHGQSIPTFTTLGQEQGKQCMSDSRYRCNPECSGWKFMYYSKVLHVLEGPVYIFPNNANSTPSSGYSLKGVQGFEPLAFVSGKLGHFPSPDISSVVSLKIWYLKI